MGAPPSGRVYHRDRQVLGMGGILLTTKATGRASGQLFQWVGVSTMATPGAVSTIAFHGTSDGQGFTGTAAQGFAELDRLLALARRSSRGAGGRAGHTQAPRTPAEGRSPHRGDGRRVACGTGYFCRPCMISRMRSAVSDGVLPTLTPAASRASCLAAAVPDEPDTMAPAWPMVLPSGAVKPAT